jgi:hypothetical protein
MAGAAPFASPMALPGLQDAKFAKAKRFSQFANATDVGCASFVQV